MHVVFIRIVCVKCDLRFCHKGEKKKRLPLQLLFPTKNNFKNSADIQEKIERDQYLITNKWVEKGQTLPSQFLPSGKL